MNDQQDEKLGKEITERTEHERSWAKRHSEKSNHSEKTTMSVDYAKSPSPPRTETEGRGERKEVGEGRGEWKEGGEGGVRWRHSIAWESPSPPARRSPTLKSRSSRHNVDITFDVVLQKEEDPEFMTGLHDLTKEKDDARRLLVEAIPEKEREAEDKYAKPKIDSESSDRTKFGAKLRGKQWVPRIINPLDIKLMKYSGRELKDVYDILEDPRSGLANTNDIQTVVRACGSEPTPAMIDDIVKTVGLDHTGNFTIRELEGILSHRLQEQDPIEEIERAFKRMSRGKKGRVTLDDLREVSKMVDYPLTDDELEEMINAARPTGTGTHKEATLGGFVRVITSKHWYDISDKRSRARRKNEKTLPLTGPSSRKKKL